LPDGQLCYELTITGITKAAHDPPPAPADLAPPADAKKSPLGVAYKMLKAGKGKQAKPTDTVKVHYTGWTADGRMFDSTAIKGDPAEVALPSAIKGWLDMLPLMHEGDSVRMWVPAELAFKDQPSRPQGLLVYEVQLLETKPTKIIDTPGGTSAPKAPPDVAAPPKDAKKSPKGVFYKFLTRGKGGAHPKATSTVKVEYAGWTTDGQLFDSSAQKGPQDIMLKQAIPGWEDAIPLMAVGDKIRLWVPEALAYQGLDDGPKGMLVFDVELLEIVK
jgi:peptidylprolyl isomerase